jgi:hypothetical protein
MDLDFDRAQEVGPAAQHLADIDTEDDLVDHTVGHVISSAASVNELRAGCPMTKRRTSRSHVALP